MRRVLGAVVLSTLVIALAACGGGSDDTADTNPTDPSTVETPPETSPAGTQPAETQPADTMPADTSPTESAPADTAAPVDTEPPADSEPPSTELPSTEADPADLAIAEAALLTLDDMPQNWTELPLDDGDDDEADSPAVEVARQDFAACFGVEADGEDDPFGIGGARAKSGEFTDRRDFTIKNDVGITDEEQASLVIERYSDPSVPACVVPAMVAVVQAGLAEDPELAAFEVGEVTVEQLELTSWGDGTIGYRTAVPVSGPEGSFVLYTDQIVVRVGRGLTSLQFQSPNSPFEVVEVDSYAMLAAERLGEAFAAS
jgi:hypothetical protein